MNVIRDLICLANLYAAHPDARGKFVSLKTLGSRILKDGKAFARLEGGGDLVTRKAAHALQWFSDNWHADLPWPDGIARPAVSDEAHHAQPPP